MSTSLLKINKIKKSVLCKVIVVLPFLVNQTIHTSSLAFYLTNTEHIFIRNTWKLQSLQGRWACFINQLVLCVINTQGEKQCLSAKRSKPTSISSSSSSPPSLESSSACCSHSRKGVARRRTSATNSLLAYLRDGLAAHSRIAFSSTMSSSYSSYNNNNIYSQLT